MKAESSKNLFEAKSIIRLAIITLSVLSLPLLAMIFNWQVHDPGSPDPEQVNWDLFDFIVMGILIFGTGLTYELLKVKVGDRLNRIILLVALLGAFFLVWAELAVGIFGSPIAGS